jgi:glucosamine-6-phosphate deaminase
VASLVAAALRQQPTLVLGLPTGRTPVELYAELIRLHRRGRADFRRATSFNLDEFTGLRADDPRSFHAFMRAHLFDHVNVTPARVHILDGAARDRRRETRRFDRALARAGGLDVCIVGIGRNGHVAFNEPAKGLKLATHVSRLAPSTRRDNAAAFGGRTRDVPRQALTVGMGAILGARGVILLATGASKAAIVRRALLGPATPRVPASLLQWHPNVLVVLDREAATSVGDRRRRRRRAAS